MHSASPCWPVWDVPIVWNCYKNCGTKGGRLWPRLVTQVIVLIVWQYHSPLQKIYWYRSRGRWIFGNLQLYSLRVLMRKSSVCGKSIAVITRLASPWPTSTCLSLKRDVLPCCLLSLAMLWGMCRIVIPLTDVLIGSALVTLPIHILLSFPAMLLIPWAAI